MNRYPRKEYQWQCRDRSVQLGKRTVVMGILNTTPDSFSDGGSFYDPNAAVDRALAMIDEGADIIDIGGESTRPGAEPVDLSEEIKRTVPVIERIRNHSEVLISIDTMKSEVAREAVAAGADIINDVSACEFDPNMVQTVSKTNAAVILMHKKGSPKTMQSEPMYEHVVDEVKTYLLKRAEVLISKGVERSRIVVDPGIGFGKTLDHNLDLLRNIPVLAENDFPVLIGASRKRMIGQLLNREDPSMRTAGSLGVAASSLLQGAHILRVHDVIDTCDVCRILDTICSGDV